MTNRYEQARIEELAKDLSGTWIVDLEGNPHDLSEVLMQCDIENIAEQLWEMNYRKASEVAAEIFEQLDRFCMVKPSSEEDYAELKKKHESECAE